MSKLFFILKMSNNLIFFKMTHSLMLLFLVLCITKGVAMDFSNNPPNPQLLLKGMVSARMQIPPSRLWIRLVHGDSIISNDRRYLVEFDGNYRRFTEITSKGQETIEDKIQYDGKDVSRYRDGDVALYEIERDTGSTVFDPRNIGLTETYKAWGQIDWFDAPEQKNWEVSLVGSESINNEAVWRVRITAPHCKFDWWINDKENFRVYRYMADMGENGRYEVNSLYGDSYPWLPTNVVVQFFDKTGKVTRETGLTILKTESNVKFPDNTWTLAGMGLPTNDITVTDLRLAKVIGFWNGSRIRPYSEPQPPQPFKAVPPPMNTKRVIFIILILAALCVPLGWMITSQLRRGK